MASHPPEKILIADDSALNRALLSDILDERYAILEAEDGEQAVAMLSSHGETISLVLIDIVMPKMDGFQVLAWMHKRKLMSRIPVIMISAENTSSSIRHAYDLGVTDYISRPFDAEVVRKRISNTLLLYARQHRLVEMVTDEIYQKNKTNSMMISILSNIVEVRNGESGLHVLHVNLLTGILLRAVCKKTGRYKLEEEDIEHICMVSAMHDIGKIVIPDSILNKPGRLTPEEFEVIKMHTTAGADMIKSVPFDQRELLLATAHDICRWHHERYDGRGYPDGLKGDEIPISAQVVSLADVYDALTSKRVYKEAYPHEKAVEMIISGECGAFNPLLVECLLENQELIQKEMRVVSYSERDKAEIFTRTFRRLEREVSQMGNFLNAPQ